MTDEEPEREKLDSAQYTSESIKLYEAVFGEDFVSPGGYDVAVELITKLNLQPGARVLDAGCGLGGSAFVMAAEFGLNVDGIDLSHNMLSIANEKLESRQLQERVYLRHGDCLLLDCDECYDAVYSRDVFLHIEDKPRLFSVFYSVLKPGGKLLFTDYCCSDKPWRKDFADYVQGRQYSLHTLPHYCELISGAGFTGVESDDLTDRFIEILKGDLRKIDSLDLAEASRQYLRQSWQGKLDRARSGNHRWGLFSANKTD